MAEQYQAQPVVIYYVPYNIQVQQNFKQWEIGMGESLCEQPAMCCINCFCLPCKAYDQREITADPGTHFRCLDIDCRGGCFECFDACVVCPKSPCMCLEAWCCLPWQILTVRHRVQYKTRARNSSCDNFLLCCFLFAEICGDCCRDPKIRCIIHLSTFACMACMLTQQQVEMEKAGIAPAKVIMQ